MHVHVRSSGGEAKFWIEPTIALADYTGYSTRTLKELQKLVEEREDAIRDAWRKHFGSYGY